MTPESRTVSSRRTAAVSAQPHWRLKDVDVTKIGRIPGGKGLLPMPSLGGVSRPVQPERVSVTKACQVMGPTLPSMAKPGTS